MNSQPLPLAVCTLSSATWLALHPLGSQGQHYHWFFGSGTVVLRPSSGGTLGFLKLIQRYFKV